MEPEARGVTDAIQSEFSNKKPDQNANFEDDLFLGAEGEDLNCLFIFVHII